MASTSSALHSTGNQCPPGRLVTVRSAQAARIGSPNVDYANRSLNGGRLSLPVLFVNGDYDPMNTIKGNQLGEPTRKFKALSEEPPLSDAKPGRVVEG